MPQSWHGRRQRVSRQSDGVRDQQKEGRGGGKQQKRKEERPYLSQFMTPDWVTNHVMGKVTCHRPFLCLFTYVWSHVLFWKLYTAPMLRELTSLSLNINFNTLITCPLSEADLVTGGPAYKLSPSLLLGSQFRLWGNQLLQQH